MFLNLKLPQLEQVACHVQPNDVGFPRQHSYPARISGGPDSGPAHFTFRRRRDGAGDFVLRPPQDLARWLTATARQDGTIAPGTKITIGNWPLYQQYMPMGMQELFAGWRSWKMPQEVEIDVGPTVIHPLPPAYIEAPGNGVRVVHLPNGHNDIANYVAGQPFPNPQEPDKGYKLLVDLWFAYAPHLIAGTPANPFRTCVEDRYSNISCTLLSYVYRQTAYNTDPGFAREDPGTDVWFTEWTGVEAPEQSKYTAQLTEFFKDHQRPEELYVYIPAFRRSIRLGVPARCTQVVGTDYLQDDSRNIGFNGGIALFDARFLGPSKDPRVDRQLRRRCGQFS